MNPSFNTSAQVERIREILVGRQLGDVEDRLTRLEATPPADQPTPALGPHDDFSAPSQPFGSSPFSASAAPDYQQSIHRLEELQAAVIEQNHQMQQQMSAESQLRQQQAEAFTAHIHHLHQSVQTLVSHQADTAGRSETRQELEEATTQMASHIDARLREILQHLQTDILQWRNEMNREIATLGQAKVDHQQLRSRLSQIAAAAMAEDPTPPPADGYLL